MVLGPAKRQHADWHLHGYIPCGYVTRNGACVHGCEYSHMCADCISDVQFAVRFVAPPSPYPYPMPPLLHPLPCVNDDDDIHGMIYRTIRAQAASCTPYRPDVASSTLTSSCL